MVCLSRIGGLTDERRDRGTQAVQSVERSHAAGQTLMGPIMSRTCRELWDSVEIDAKDGHKSIHHEQRDFTLTQAPSQLKIGSKSTLEPLYRGLYKVNAYQAQFDAQADFDNLIPLQPRAEHAQSRLVCDDPTIWVALSDVRGLRNGKFSIDGKNISISPGTPNEHYPSGFKATLPVEWSHADAEERRLTVRVTAEIEGTRQMAWIPAAASLEWTLASDWPHPAFGGDFLPSQRQIDTHGFTATWHISSLATTALADLEKGHSLCVPEISDPSAAESASLRSASCLDTLAVSFIDPVNPYVLNDRALKYALLFVGLTFGAVALVEILWARRVHPVQYFLVGLAQSIFFLLLLSLSEHLNFGIAYGIAAFAVSGLLGFYASAMFGRWLGGIAFSASVAGLYAMLYVLLQMEQTALVIGSVMLFVVLTVVMTSTRRLDWYRQFESVRLSSPNNQG